MYKKKKENNNGGRVKEWEQQRITDGGETEARLCERQLCIGAVSEP